METSKHHSNSKTKQRHEHRHIILQTHLTSLSDSKNNGEDTTPVHHKQHPTHLHATWLQKQLLYKHSTTQHKQHHPNRLQNKPPERTITVALDMSKAFDTVNIHTLTHKLRQTKIPHTIIKYIENYIKGRKVYTTFRNKTSTRQFKNGVPQGGVL